MATMRCKECNEPVGLDHLQDCSILAAESYKGFQVLNEQCDSDCITAAIDTVGRDVIIDSSGNIVAEAPQSADQPELSLHLVDRLEFGDKL